MTFSAAVPARMKCTNNAVISPLSLENDCSTMLTIVFPKMISPMIPICTLFNQWKHLTLLIVSINSSVSTLSPSPRVNRQALGMFSLVDIDSLGARCSRSHGWSQPKLVRFHWLGIPMSLLCGFPSSLLMFHTPELQSSFKLTLADSLLLGVQYQIYVGNCQVWDLRALRVHTDQ